MHVVTDEATQADSFFLDIHETPGVSGGYPCVGATRIPVRAILEDYRELGSLSAVAALYSDLLPAQISNALLYYALHPTRVDEDIARNTRAMELLQAR